MPLACLAHLEFFFALTSCLLPLLQFCYYNNYNIKQPRYFCKACQRYWTAGGILRNVPVGAGRRKSKASAVRELEKAAAAAAAKQARQVAAHGGSHGPAPTNSGAPGGPGLAVADAGQPLQLMSAAGDLLPAGPMPANGSFGPEQLRFMLDPMACSMGGGGMMGPPGGAPMMGAGPMGYDSFGPSAGMMLPPHAAGGICGLRPPRADGGAGLLPSCSGLGSGLGSGHMHMQGPDGGGLSGPVDSGVSPGAAGSAGQDGRRVRAKLEGGAGGGAGSLNGGIPPSSSGMSLQLSAGGKGGLVAASSGDDDCHPEWVAAAQAAERQQAAALAAQMAAQASMQQAAAMQVLLCLLCLLHVRIQPAMLVGHVTACWLQDCSPAS